MCITLYKNNNRKISRIKISSLLQFFHNWQYEARSRLLLLYLPLINTKAIQHNAQL